MEEQNEIQVPETNYVEVITNLKANTVSKSEYERVLNENKTLAEALATSPATTVAEEVKPEYTQEDLDRIADQSINHKHRDNLEFMKTLLEWSDALKEVKGVDGGLPTNSGYVATDYDTARSEEIANALRQMVEYSNGDPKLFNSELKRCAK